MAISPLQLLKLINPNFQDAGYVNVPSGALATGVNGTGIGNAAATTNTVLFTAAIPANTLNIINSLTGSGGTINIQASGKFAATANNKVIQIYVGSDVQTVGSAIVTTATASILTTGVITQNGGGWAIEAEIAKYGVANANTQLGLNLGMMYGTTHGGTQTPTALTLVENVVNYISITGASSTTGAANDVLGQFFQPFWVAP